MKIFSRLFRKYFFVYIFPIILPIYLSIFPAPKNKITLLFKVLKYLISFSLNGFALEKILKICLSKSLLYLSRLDVKVDAKYKFTSLKTSLNSFSKAKVLE